MLEELRLRPAVIVRCLEDGFHSYVPDPPARCHDRRGGGADPHRGPDHDDWQQGAGCPAGYGGLVRARLLDRDAELRALTRQVAAVRAGAGRVITVDGPAGIGKTSLLGAVADTAEADGVAVLRARSGPLEQDAAWGVARQLFEPLRAGEVWSELAVGAAKLATRALDPATAEPASAGDAMYAAARGLVWLAANLATRGPAVLVVDLSLIHI